jgi:hypothetical protein
LCSPESIVPFRFSRWSWHTEGLNRISYDDGENGSLNINQSKQPSRTKSAKDILGLIGEWERKNGAIASARTNSTLLRIIDASMPVLKRKHHQTAECPKKKHLQAFRLCN